MGIYSIVEEKMPFGRIRSWFSKGSIADGQLQNGRHDDDA